MLLAAVEICFLSALIAGVYLLFGLGVALVSLGVLGILACERASR